MSQAPLARTEDLVVQSVGDETIIVDSRTDQAHALPAPVAQVWELCDGNRSVDAIVEALNVEPAFVTQALEELEGCNLLEVVEPAGLVSRRVMLTGTAGLAATGALIATVGLPAVAMAGSLPVGSSITFSGTAGGAADGGSDNGVLTYTVTPGSASGPYGPPSGNSDPLFYFNEDGTGTNTGAGGSSSVGSWQVQYVGDSNATQYFNISFSANGTAETGSYSYSDTTSPFSDASTTEGVSDGFSTQLPYTDGDTITLTLGFLD